MKRCLMLFTIICLAVCLSLPVYSADTQEHVWKQLYVSPNGDDGADGSENAPFKTIGRAQEEVRNISGEMSGDIVVNIKSGYYFLSDTLDFGTEDSGKNGHRIIYRGEAGNMPVVSGGRRISGFEKSDEYPSLWEAHIDGIDEIRELYVNEQRRFRAASNVPVTGVGMYDDKNTIYDNDGIYVSKEDFGFYENPKDIELVWVKEWMTHYFHIDSIIPDPDNPNQLIIKMQQSWWDQQVKFNKNNNYPNYDRPFTVENAFELLDTPGEFYFDKTKKTLYYMPKLDENMDTAVVIAPYLEKIMRFTGNDICDKVCNISIENLKIAHAAWNAFSTGAASNRQSQLWEVSDNLPGRIDGTILLDRAKNIEFRGNYFFGFGASAVDLKNSVEDTKVIGNVISDTGDAGVVIGMPWQDNNMFPNGTSPAPPSPAPSQFNLINGEVRVSASFFGFRDQDSKDNKYTTALSGKNIWYSPSDPIYGQTWTSDPYGPEKNERQWIKYDFEKPYTISRIMMSFDPSKVTDSEKQGFEILLSNDKNFSDGSYMTAASQTEPAENKMVYDIDAKGEKYRYMMIRTTAATKLAVSGVWAFTPDVKLYTRYERCRNNIVSDNLIKRTSLETYSGGAVNTFYTENLTLTHNEIEDIPYSGITTGWGWSSASEGTANNNISYNHIKM